MKQISGVCEVPNQHWARMGTTLVLRRDLGPEVERTYIGWDDNDDETLNITFVT